jgi:hypothetical protein
MLWYFLLPDAALIDQLVGDIIINDTTEKDRSFAMEVFLVSVFSLQVPVQRTYQTKP